MNISNTDDMIDSRDVIERIDELQGNDDLDADEQEELAALLALQEEAEGYAPDWMHGCALIRDSYFTEYMDDMLQDIGDFPKNLPSYLRIEVDYEALQQDYTSVEFNGVTYWVR